MDDELRKQLALGREAFEQRHYHEAERIFEQVLSLHKTGLPDVLNMAGLCAHHRGDFSKAQQQFERALKLNAGYTDAALNLAVTYADLGHYERAQETLQGLGLRGQRLGENNELEPFARGKIANMHAEVAQAYEDLGRLDDAIIELRRATKLAPTFADLRTRLAQHLHSTGHLEQAEAELRIVLEHSPRFVPAKLRLGLVLASRKHFDKAHAQWNEVLELEPENAVAKMYLRAHAQ